MRVLITGGAGFVGHHLVQYLLEETEWELVLLDRLDHSGNLNRLAEVGLPNSRARFIFHDLRAPITSLLASWIGQLDYILHLGAATHVDRSIACPMDFVQDNVVGTCNLLNFARDKGFPVLYFSTDEVFGPAPEGVSYKEDDRYRSGNPYAATKAGAEELCVAYANTYKLPVAITHCMNIFGERQHPEKMIPMTIRRVLNGEEVLIHADATRTRPGSRFYIHAREVAHAIHFLVLCAPFSGEKYNIVGEREVDNLELALAIAAEVGNELRYELVDFHSSRPGHDLRYALDGSKLAAMGWSPQQSTEENLKRTVRWTLANPAWMGDRRAAT